MRWLNDFKSFILRGNLVDLAIGFTVGAAFSTVAKSLVSDILMPPIGLMTGGADFSDLFVVLKTGEGTEGAYQTLAEAQSAGAVTLNYGEFGNNLLALLVVAIAMFLLIRLVGRLERTLDATFDDDDPSENKPTDKKCPFCRTTIAYAASRCPNCTSTLEPAGVEPSAGTQPETT